MKVKTKVSFIDSHGFIQNNEYAFSVKNFNVFKNLIKQSAILYAENRKRDVKIIESDKHLFINYLDVKTNLIDRIYLIE